MKRLFIKSLDEVLAGIKEHYDKTWDMHYAVKAFIDTLKGYEDKPITQKALQEYCYKKEKYTRYVMGESNYISFTIGKDQIGRKQLSIHGLKDHNYGYYDNQALRYELPLYDAEKYKTWGDVIAELEDRLNSFTMPTYNEEEIKAKYAECVELAERWNAMEKDPTNIWNYVED